jgi:hypothetical protein
MCYQGESFHGTSCFFMNLKEKGWDAPLVYYPIVLIYKKRDEKIKKKKERGSETIRSLLSCVLFYFSCRFCWTDSIPFNDCTDWLLRISERSWICRLIAELPALS